MKQTIDEHAARFDEKAGDYDGDHAPQYEANLERVIATARPTSSDTVLDLGTGTGAVALALAADADGVIGRDISDDMIAEARDKATTAGVENVEFGPGRFREPNVSEPIDIITSNYALHHLDDESKREAIGTLVELDPRRIVIGDLMFFAAPDPDHPGFDPSVDDPARVGNLAQAMTDAGFAVTDIHRVSSHVGVIVGTRPQTE